MRLKKYINPFYSALVLLVALGILVVVIGDLSFTNIAVVIMIGLAWYLESCGFKPKTKK